MGACWAGLFGMPARWSRGRAVSSAILYLAIVAIWAVVLVPRWLRLRSAPARYEPAEDFEDAAELEDTADAEADGTADAEADGTTSTRRAPIEWEDSPPPSYELFDTPEAVSAGHPADPVEPSDSPGEDVTAEHEEPAPAAAGAPMAVPSAAERRARVLRTRRRMLVTVVSLAAAATVLAVIHLAPVWVVMPPALMLAGFLVLLREAAHTDALRARQQLLAQGHSSAEAGQEEDGPAETPAAPAASAPAAAAPAEADSREPGTGQFGEATAQVIDISQRFGDQLYDQYTDAAERAVGD